MDLLTALPDDVRSHILSFLTTKESVQTSVLSKKWRHMFTRVPILDLDDSVFLHPGNFMDFVDRVLALQGDSSIERFSLKCGDGVYPQSLDGWICNALRRGVSELDLSINFEDEDNYHLPREVFVSKTLVKLKVKLKSYFYWWVGADDTFLPMLKALHIACKTMSMNCDGEMEKFLACFPVLEEAEFISMDWVDSLDIVCSSTLKKLSIVQTGMKTVRNRNSVSFDTPNLRFLDYSDWVAEDYPLVNLSKLDVARIGLLMTDRQTRKRRRPRKYVPEGDLVRFGNVIKLMNGIKNVKELHLHPDTLEVLSLCYEYLPVFNNLKKLIITSDKGRGWQAMPSLLRNCPQLEYLLIKGLVHHVAEECGDVCNCLNKKGKGRSLKSCPVKTFVIRGFRGTMDEMNMIEQFLDHFPCLEEMNIYIDEDATPLLKYDRQYAVRVLETIKELDYSHKCNVQLIDEWDYTTKTLRSPPRGDGSCLQHTV